MQGNSFVFYFEGTSRIELVRTEVRVSGTARTLNCIRGKTAGAYVTCGSFQWTSGVRGVCAAFMRFLLSEQSDVVDFCLIGGKGSLAASLDYAMSKGPAWLGEMFGSGVGGIQLARRIFKITNPNRKRPGPVAISVNKNVVSADQVHIYWENKLVTDSTQLYSMLVGIEEQGGDSQSKTMQRVVALSDMVNL
ncbi:MAG: hypothetical protein RL518_1391 [Pseudomonadota bacterium]